MPIKLKSSGGGSVTLDVPNTGTDYTLTMPANNATIFTTAGGTISGNVAFTGNNVSIGGQTISPAVGMRNRIINGAMMIDQRYNGVANTVPTSGSSYYVIDRFFHGNFSGTGTYTVQQMNGANTSASNYESGSVPPAGGFINSMKLTVGTANTSTPSGGFTGVYQAIEGLNTYDLSWGTSAAKSITVSFWTKSSITGQFSAGIWNSTATQTYPMSFTISQANTWQFVTLVVPGSTTGTWPTNNSAGLNFAIFPSLGSGYLSSSTGWTSNLYGLTGQTNWMATSGNTFYITGLQIEVGTSATSFEFRHYGTELALCKRYYYQIQSGTAAVDLLINGYNYTTIQWESVVTHPVEMRVVPTVTFTATNTFNLRIAGTISALLVYYSDTTLARNALLIYVPGSGMTQGYSQALMSASGSKAGIYFNAEL